MKKELFATQTVMHSLAAKSSAQKTFIDDLSHRCGDLEMKRANIANMMFEHNRLLQEQMSVVMDIAKAFVSVASIRRFFVR